MLKHFPEIPPFEKSPSYKELGLFLFKKKGESRVSLHMFSNRWKNHGLFDILKNLCYNIKKRYAAARPARMTRGAAPYIYPLLL